MIFFSIHNHYNITQLQHVLLGLLSVRKEPLKESEAKAAGRGCKIHLDCLSIPEDESEIKPLILTHVDSVFYFQNFIAISRQYCAVVGRQGDRVIMFFIDSAVFQAVICIGSCYW